jgi:hypothetical protein
VRSYDKLKIARARVLPIRPDQQASPKPGG